MKSKLTISEFRKRLKENTKIGRPELQLSLGPFSIFFLSSKIFYGTFDDTTFRLTKNYNFSSDFYILKGKYQKSEGIVKLNYSIKPITKTGIIWLKYFPFVAIIGFNFFLFYTSENSPYGLPLALNLFIVFVILFSRWDLKRKKKKLEQTFLEIFEIENVTELSNNDPKSIQK